MWILLTHRLPTIPSPPLYSVHWAGASAENVTRVKEQQTASKKLDKTEQIPQKYLFDVGDKFIDLTWDMYDTKEEGAVWIIFDAEPIKVWPHEYRTLSKDTFFELLTGTDKVSTNYTLSHVPMYGRHPLFIDPLSCDFIRKFEMYPLFQQEIYEAAQIDGANDIFAFYTAICAENSIPLDLWFAVIEPYGNLFGFSEQDMTPRYKDNPVLDKIKAGWVE